MIIVLTSLVPKGTFFNVTVFSNKIEEAIKGRTAFFAPLQLIKPLTPLEEKHFNVLKDIITNLDKIIEQ